MPTYSYRCPECMYTCTQHRVMRDRDMQTRCMQCAFSDIVSWCERVPTSAAFTVKGFNAQNGYAKET